jgi:hypothetical protein
MTAINEPFFIYSVQTGSFVAQIDYAAALRSKVKIPKAPETNDAGDREVDFGDIGTAWR